MSRTRKAVRYFIRLERGHKSENDLISLADYWHLPLTWQYQLEEANIITPLDTSLKKLSGGQRARLLLSHAFSLSNNFLLIDEPSNHLDENGCKWLREKIIKNTGGILTA
ncbi:ATP-binding cassette domain-containing protein [Microbulbifer sp. VTAC004]|uniref:ATP-binding cassette domain-containing protein n=1 Tax=Microbulbifer sp. VTAC004 TaxID=3243386 RepID=UPI00403A4BF7